MAISKGVCLLVLVLAIAFVNGSQGMLSHKTMVDINIVNGFGPYIGIVVPNGFEMGPLLGSSSFKQDKMIPFPYLDFAGKRFRFGTIGEKKVIVVMTGLAMLNAGITTQLLLSFFDVKGVVHYGIAGNANPSLQIGDVTIPKYWAHTGLWNWQRYGQGPQDELAFEAFGDYTRTVGSIHFAGFNNDSKLPVDNFLNSAWYQPEETFPVNGTPEVRNHSFWIPVDTTYLNVSHKLQGLPLQSCINATLCLPKNASVVFVDNGASANTFVDNAAYRNFLFSKFNITAIDMETAAVALVSLQQQVPFIAIRSLSDLAGGGSTLENEAELFGDLAAQNAVIALIKFIELLP